MKGLFKKALSVAATAAIALSLTSGIPVRLPVDLSITASAANEITWPAVGDTVTVETISYKYAGDFSATALSVDSSAENSIYKAGNGYVLWNNSSKTVTLHDASITAFSALTVPKNVSIVVEGSNVLTGTNSYGLVCNSGGLSVSGSGSLEILTTKTPDSWVYSCNAGSGDININITGNFVSNGIHAQNGSVTIESKGSVDVTGLIRAGSAVSIKAKNNLSIANSTNFAIQNQGSGVVSLISETGNISVNTSAANKYAISASSSAVTLDAAGTVSAVAASNEYAGVYGSSLALSGTIPAGSTLRSTCDVTVPAEKTLTNYGTLSVETGKVTVAGALVKKSGSAIKYYSSDIDPITTGSGTITDAPATVNALDFRSDSPSAAKEYIISGGGTAKWEPGSAGTANKLTLNGVTMTGTSYLVAVPANTEIILTGTNKITATSGYAIAAEGTGAVLKITGTGSLEVSKCSYPLYGAAGIDVDINGAITVNGQIRGNGGSVSIKSDDAITVNGSIFASGSINAKAGKSLSIVNSNGAGIYATLCDDVTLTAGNGDLKVQGNGNYAIQGKSETTISLSAAGNLNVSGNSDSSPYNIKGKTLKLEGTVPAGTSIYTNSDIVIPAKKVLTNYGTLQLYNTSSTVTVDGTLNNYGAIINCLGKSVTPIGSGIINEKGYLDFTDSTTPASGDGYSWNSTSKTLTLDGIIMDTPSIGSAIVLPDGANLVLNGTNTLNSQIGALIEAKGSLEISGGGSLNGTSGSSAALNAHGDVTITDCTLNLTATRQYASVINTNGKNLTIAGVSDVTLTDIAAGSFGVDTGDGDFTLGSNAKLTVEAKVGILVGGDDSYVQKTKTVKINGTLDTSRSDSLCANLKGVKLDLQGSSIVMKDGTHIWLWQATDTLTGEKDLKSFTGLLRASTGDEASVDYYKVTKDAAIGLYAENSEVSFTADNVEGKVFTGWTAEGITLGNPKAPSISFTMPSNDVTLTTNYCDHEGFTVIKSDSAAHWYDCTNCGETEINRELHSGGTADCINRAKCTDCTTEYGTVDTSNHADNVSAEWTFDETEHWHKCACGARLDLAAHTSSGEATEDTAETCTICEYVIAPATGHINHTADASKWLSDETKHWHKCAGCEEKMDIAVHTFSDWNIETEATATKEGKKTRTCSTCSYVDEVVIPVIETAAAPVFNPASSSFRDSVNVTITSADGAAIYYTTDGSAPTTASAKYTGTITITSTTTIKAIAVKDGLADSQVSSATYTKQTTGGNGGGGYVPTPPKPSTPSAPVTPDDDDDAAVIDPSDTDDDAANKSDTDESKGGDEPQIKGDDGKSGWDKILDELEDANDGDTVIVDMKGTTELPKDILDEIKGRDINLVLEMDNGFVWTINGKDVTDPQTVDMGVSNGSDIPVKVINNVTGECYYITITLEHDGEFGFKAVLTVDMGKENKGYFANLYYYIKDEKDAEFICSDEIDSEGRADLTFAHASEYIIVVDEYDHGVAEDISSAAGTVEENDEAPLDDDVNPVTGVTISFAGVILSAAALVAAKKRKTEECRAD